jgi:hypothetical protein
MTLWLKNRGWYDRKSKESSNLAFLPPSHTAPQPLPSADTVEIHCFVKTSDPGNIHISCTKTRSVSLLLATPTRLGPAIGEGGNSHSSFVLGPSHFTRVVSRSAGLERNAKTDEPLNSRDSADFRSWSPQLFDHAVKLPPGAQQV